MRHRHWLSMLGLILAGLGLSGCAAMRSELVPVHINGVNFTDQTVLYLLFDPTQVDPELTAMRRVMAFGGAVLPPLSAVEAKCCYQVPKHWVAGTQVGVEFVVHSEDGKTPARQTRILDLPPYGAGDQAGELWFMYHSEQKIDVVSSVHRPYTDAWPSGSLSLDFQRKLWERDLERAQMDVRLAQAFIIAFERDPQADLSRTWQMYVTYNAENPGTFKEPSLFSGPQDPAFILHEQAKRKDTLDRATQKLERLRKLKP